MSMNMISTDKRNELITHKEQEEYERKMDESRKLSITHEEYLNRHQNDKIKDKAIHLASNKLK